MKNNIVICALHIGKNSPTEEKYFYIAVHNKRKRPGDKKGYNVRWYLAFKLLYLATFAVDKENPKKP